MVYQLDVALENTDTQRSGLVFIYDMTESKYSNFDYDLSQKILTLLKVIVPFYRDSHFRKIVSHEKCHDIDIVRGSSISYLKSLFTFPLITFPQHKSLYVELVALETAS